MKKYIYKLFLLSICLGTVLIAQIPSTQLKIKTTSGFLGMGGPRNVIIELSNKNNQQPLTCTNVNSDEFYYFLFKPLEDWKLDEDFVKENLAKVTIVQNDKTSPIVWKSEIIVAEKTSIILGFAKTFNLYQPFEFQCPEKDSINKAIFNVPMELWPGYAMITLFNKQAESLYNNNQFKFAIWMYEKILSEKNLNIFPQYSDARTKRTESFKKYNDESVSVYNNAITNSEIDLKSRIALLDGLKPNFQYIIDSLPRVDFGVASIDTNIAPLIGQSRDILLNISTAQDSLQRVLDFQTVKWIMESSVTGKDGHLYVYMIETLAYAFSSLNFADTNASELRVKIPMDFQARLAKNNLTETYETMIRICNERFKSRLAIFPIEFLPNLKKDSASFALPYYSMLKAVNDYYYGSYESAKLEILKIFKTCYEQDINAKFDMMRVIIESKQSHISAEIFNMLDEAEQLEKSKDIQNAQEKLRQVTLLAPNFAYGYFVLGKFYIRNSDLIRANIYFQKAFQIDTLYLSAYRESYSLYFKQSNFKEMINVYNTAIAKGNTCFETFYNLGVAYLGDADPAHAIQCFEKANALNSKSYRVNIQLGLTHQQVKNYSKAREYFNNAIRIDMDKDEAVNYIKKLDELQKSAK